MKVKIKKHFGLTFRHCEVSSSEYGSCYQIFKIKDEQDFYIKIDYKYKYQFISCSFTRRIRFKNVIKVDTTILIKKYDSRSK